MLRDEVPSRLHLRLCCDTCEVREGYRHPSRFAPTLVVDDAVERTEPLHARTGRAFQEDPRLTLIEVAEEVGRIARHQEVDAVDNVEVRPTGVIILF